MVVIGQYLAAAEPGLVLQGLADVTERGRFARSETGLLPWCEQDSQMNDVEEMRLGTIRYTTAHGRDSCS